MPLPVDETELAAIRVIVTSKVFSRPWKFLNEGDRVRIDGGPLRGIEAILVTVADDRYAVVNMTIMRRAVAVKIHPSLISSSDARPVSVTMCCT
jgi:transcription antitermination factor NusG